MNRSRKWAFIGQEAQRLVGLGMTPREIAERLEVQKSTVTRWIASGKLVPAKARRRTGATAPPQSQGKWAASVRETYALDPTDEQLVVAGEQALAIVHDMAESPTTRLAAMGRFQSIVKQLSLGLSDRRVEAPEERQRPTQAPTLRQVQARVGGGIDPRSILQAVK